MVPLRSFTGPGSFSLIDLVQSWEFHRLPNYPISLCPGRCALVENAQNLFWICSTLGYCCMKVILDMWQCTKVSLDYELRMVQYAPGFNLLVPEFSISHYMHNVKLFIRSTNICLLRLFSFVDIGMITEVAMA
jgi:hypothetical protein